MDIYKDYILNGPSFTGVVTSLRGSNMSASGHTKMQSRSCTDTPSKVTNGFKGNESKALRTESVSSVETSTKYEYVRKVLTTLPKKWLHCGATRTVKIRPTNGRVQQLTREETVPRTPSCRPACVLWLNN